MKLLKMLRVRETLKGVLARTTKGRQMPVCTGYQCSTEEPSLYERIKLMDTEFTNRTGTVFGNKSNGEVLRGLTVLWLCSSKMLIRYNQQLMKISRAVLGSYLYQRLMNLTFYGQFVIGRDEKTVRPIIERYLIDGVGPILYYALEEDKSDSSSLSNDLFYEKNVQSFKEAIDITGKATNRNGFIAVKPTALCSPKLLVKLTQVILKLTKGTDMDSYHTQSNLLCPAHQHELSIEELNELNKLVKRTEDIIQYAMDKGVRVMIDAEQTYFQPAIQRLLGVDMMKRFNKESIVVFVTYQTYLKGAVDNIERDLKYCKKGNIKFGARIVRGAYLDQERLLSKQNGYEDPTNPSFEATSAMYHSTAEYLLREMFEGINDMEVMFATHNEDTLKYILNLMIELKCSGNISFGQLYGMCEHITFQLGQAGVPVYKSMPYGAIELITSYLGRRAIENRGTLKKVRKERRLLFKEMKERMWKWKR